MASPTTERAELLDALRGLALFGVAFSNYLMQTFIGIALFTGMGCGWGTHVSAVVFEGIAVAVFVVEVIWSRWWLKRFRFGPFEWLWRSLTYGRVMPLRIERRPLIVQGGSGPE